VFSSFSGEVEAILENVWGKQLILVLHEWIEEVKSMKQVFLDPLA